MAKLKLAILDDYVGAALNSADWSRVAERCDITVFDRNLAVPDEAARELAPFDIVCHLRERMAMPASLIELLPNLKLIAITGPVHRGLDLAAATARGVLVSHSGVSGRGGGLDGAAELAVTLILCLCRRVLWADRAMRSGKWQEALGANLLDRRLGLVGFGAIGQRVARAVQIFGMEVVAWSPNLTQGRVDATGIPGVKCVSREELFRTSDVISLHIVLSPTTTNLIGKAELAQMKPTAYLVNTSRGPLVDKGALIAALNNKIIAGAGLDTFWEEPLPADDPIRRVENLLLTPHLGYVSEQSMQFFYGRTAESVQAYLDGNPIRVSNPQVLGG